MSLRKTLETELNKAGAESGSNTPDYILAQYLMDCLKAFDIATKERDRWYGHEKQVNRILSCEESPRPR